MSSLSEPFALEPFESTTVSSGRAVRMIREADDVDVRTSRWLMFDGPGKAYAMRPYGGAAAPESKPDVWVVCHPDDEEKAREFVDRVRG